MDRIAVRAELDAARRDLLALAAGVDPAAWERPSPNQDWTARDTLAHVVAAEEGMRARIERALAGDAALRPDFDLHRWNRRQVERRREQSAEALLSELAAGRDASLRLLDGLDDGRLEAPIEHPANREATVGWVFSRIAEHQRAHADEIRRAIS